MINIGYFCALPCLYYSIFVCNFLCVWPTFYTITRSPSLSLCYPSTYTRTPAQAQRHRRSIAIRCLKVLKPCHDNRGMINLTHTPCSTAAMLSSMPCALWELNKMELTYRLLFPLTEWVYDKFAVALSDIITGKSYYHFIISWKDNKSTAGTPQRQQMLLK